MVKARIVEASKLKRVRQGPAMKKLAKLMAEGPRGKCAFKNCGKRTPSKKHKWCAGHRDEVRTLQLAANTAAYRQRVAQAQA